MHLFQKKSTVVYKSDTGFSAYVIHITVHAVNDAKISDFLAIIIVKNSDKLHYSRQKSALISQSLQRSHNVCKEYVARSHLSTVTYYLLLSLWRINTSYYVTVNV